MGNPNPVTQLCLEPAPRLGFVELGMSVVVDSVRRLMGEGQVEINTTLKFKYHVNKTGNNTLIIWTSSQ